MTSLENMGDFVMTSREELSIEWRIHNFFSESCEDGDGIYFISPKFHFYGACCYFDLFASLNDCPYSEELDLCLYTEDRKLNSSTATVNLTFGIKGSEAVEMKIEDEIEFSDDCDVGYHYRWSSFLSMCKLRDHKDRLVPNDILTFACEMKTSLGRFRDVEKLQKSLQSMLKSGEDCDIVFKVQGKEFPAHRTILQARSPVFRAMFAHDMFQKQSGEVTIVDCDPQVFSDLLDHVYTGSSEKINQGNVFELYAISDKYEMDTLKEQCVKCMKRNLSVASFCDVMKLALKQDDKALIEFTTQFFCSNTSDIVLTNDWTAFYEENSAFGYKLLIKTLTK